MISMISAFTISLVLLPLAHGCAPIGGDLSKTALLQMTISPPPNYTYSNSPIDGQAFTEASAERNAKRDFRAAVMSTMAEGGLFEGMVTFNADYTAPKLTIAEGTRCTEPGTYVVSQGTIVYECVEVTTTTKSTTTTTTSASEPSEQLALALLNPPRQLALHPPRQLSQAPSTTTGTSTTEPSSTTGTSTSESSTTTGTSTSESPTTTVTSTTEPSTTTGTSTTEPSTTTGTSTTTDPNQNLLRAKRAAGDVDQVQSIPYHIVASITVETMVPIAESQWKTYAEKIQSRLEQRHIVFVDDIEVQML
ncbi:hypothetical protein Q1695_013906 [Nippostrongylus brasiliensis]|nr:hypothetical protein Q1695_013906 [Nippostrongylus brasiliensis]